MQTQEIIAKDSSRSEELKTKDPKSTLLRDNITKPTKKEDKQKKLKCWQECISKPKKPLVICDNTVNTTKKKKKHNTSKVMYFNCNKKNHYVSNCTKPKN